MPRLEAASGDPRPNARRCFGSCLRVLWLRARCLKQCRLVLLVPFGTGPAHIVVLGMVRLAEGSHLFPSPKGARNRKRMKANMLQIGKEAWREGGHFWSRANMSHCPPKRWEFRACSKRPSLQERASMKSQWNDAAAQEVLSAYAAKGVGPDIALGAYSTRLLGRDPLLVLHGGGNTSVKTRASDDLGVEHEVIAVKGSGADMADIEPWGLPAVKLGPLRQLRALDALSDEAMVNVQRLNLLDSSAPNPSVETLLHAFLPHKFVDHTHAAAVLSLVDQPDGEALAREV